MMNVQEAMASDLNEAIERKANALSVAMLLSTQQGVKIPELIGEMLDQAGIMILSHCKRTLGVSAEEMAKRLAAISDDIQLEMMSRVPRT